MKFCVTVSKVTNMAYFWLRAGNTARFCSELSELASLTPKELREGGGFICGGNYRVEELAEIVADDRNFAVQKPWVVINDTISVTPRIHQKVQPRNLIFKPSGKLR